MCTDIIYCEKKNHNRDTKITSGESRDLEITRDDNEGDKSGQIWEREREV